ncbi:glycosyl transferase [Sphaerisporangium rufum]|uniref:Glycosyl transferase n=1 Tax=Sphaerisporangium rufum TaxID=1381558 RepID=A0A919R5F0_9ACTN|nr:glycosyltransferase family 9 protein [Sphaerisporangium rufum]GII80027.1 glycosyl transferase [Sphaerisporangium rufum]
MSGRERPAPPRRRDGTSPVLLALRGLGLGDLLAAVPALRALRRAHPGHRVLLAAPAPLAGLLPAIGAVDGLVDVAGPGPVPVDRPDVAVNLHGRGPQSTAALLATRPGRLITHAHPDLPAAGPPWREGVHEVRRWCDLLEWHGVPADPGDLLLRVPGPRPAGPGPVVVHPGAAHPARRWPPDRFGRVAAALAAGGHRVLVTGGAAERAIAEQVAARAGLPAASVLAGRTGLPELVDLLRSARLLVCGDTGVAHLATALGTPSVVLFGPVSPALWGPPPDVRHVALWKGRSGDPHGDASDPGLLRIEVQEVLDAVTDLLDRLEREDERCRKESS